MGEKSVRDNCSRLGREIDTTEENGIDKSSLIIISSMSGADKISDEGIKEKTATRTPPPIPSRSRRYTV